MPKKRKTTGKISPKPGTPRHQLAEQERLRAFIEGTNLGTWEWNLQTGASSFNARWAEMLGYQLNDLAPFNTKTWARLAHPDDRQLSDKAVEAYLEGKTDFYDCKYRMRHKKGHWVWVHDRGQVFTYTEGGEPELMFGTHQDISEAISILEEQKLFIAEAPQAIAMLDRELHYLAASEKWLDDYGLRGQEILGRNHYELFPEINEEWKAIHQKSLEGETLQRDEDLFLRKDGSKQWIRWVVKPWRRSDQRIGGLIMSTEDITSKKQAQEQQKRHLEQQKTQNDRLTNFAYIVSHNLRTHSSNIQVLFKYLLKEQPALRDSEFTPLIQEASGNLSQTIENLDLLVSQGLTDTPRTMVVDLRESAQKAITNVAALALEANVSLHNEIEADRSVEVIPAYLDSLLDNLLSNAIKYRSKKRTAQVHLSSRLEAEEILLSIEDNGIGIDLDAQGEALFALRSTLVESEEAHGVGLYIVKNQIESMGGKIHVDSTLGEGSTFTLHFPLIE